MNITLHFKVYFLLILLLLPYHANAQLAGHVILSKGSVLAISDNGESRPLKRRSKIMSGEVIKTGINSSVQIRFVDKALMTIKANTEMDISEYQLEKPESGQKEKAIMTLVKGGFRTISGQIGKGDKSAYKVDTPAASIGIRGTNYEVQQEASGDFVMAVYSGGISVQNESGSIELGLGSDFNFTRVSHKSAPKGLLIAPATLTENSATDQPAEEESETASATTEGEEKSEADANNDPENENEASTVAENDSESSDPNSEKTEANEIASNTESTTSDVAEEVDAALNEKLSEALKENKDDIEDKLITALVAAGVLDENEDLNDLSDKEEYVISNASNSDEIIDLATNDSDQLNTAIDAAVVPQPDTSPTDPVETETTFLDDLNNAASAVTNPFPETYTQGGITYDLITDDEYNVAASNKLAVLAMPMFYSQDADGDLSFNFSESSIQSPTAIETASYGNTITYSGSDTHINIYYELLNTSNNKIDEYRIEVPVDGSVSTPNELLNIIQNGLTSGSNIYLNDIPQASGAIDDILVSLDTIAGTSTSVFNFTADTTSDTFMTKLELNFSGSNSDTLTQQLGGNNMEDDWRNQADIELMIASGAWETSTDGDGNPIFVMSETHTESIENDDGTFIEVDIVRNEVIKPHGEAVMTNNLLSFATCGDNNGICSIQVLKDDDKIRWGAWLTEPGKGIQIYEQKEDAGSAFSDSNIHQEDQVLAFWLAAERADINSLSGTALFSSTDLNCTDFSQCIGFADDGIVQNLSGQFDVNFSNGAITNGNLNIEVSDDISFGIFGPEQGTAISTWDVNFTGQMSSSQPEFATQSINGTVTNETGATISSSVIGNIGGIFVSPGDKVAGGYNLGTADGTNKHVSGVFTLDKQP